MANTMSEPKLTIPRFTILFWTVDSPLSFVQKVNTEDELSQQLKKLQKDNNVVATATYVFLDAQQRTVRFQPLSPT